jgi:CubicO group peptidase (beta-lactamase class C family)
MPAWRPLFRETATREEAFELALQTPLKASPGTSDIYSDLGMIVLTRVVESVFGMRIDSLLQQRIFDPLGMTSVRFRPPSQTREIIAPTELDPWRGRVLRGEVHDENAARMDGVSGHAGLFGSAPDLLTFSEWLLDGWTTREQTHEWASRQARAQADKDPDNSALSITPSVIRTFTSRQNIFPGSSRALGWDNPSPGSSAGTRLSPNSVGHTGFTGTSIWIDPDRKVAIVLLSNPINPTRNNQRWFGVRAKVADLVMTTLFPDSR